MRKILSFIVSMFIVVGFAAIMIGLMSQNVNPSSGVQQYIVRKVADTLFKNAGDWTGFTSVSDCGISYIPPAPGVALGKGEAVYPYALNGTKLECIRRWADNNYDEFKMVVGSPDYNIAIDLYKFNQVSGTFQNDPIKIPSNRPPVGGITVSESFFTYIVCNNPGDFGWCDTGFYRVIITSWGG